jgi:ferredoxin-NADP reductase
MEREYIVKLLETRQVTHDVKQFRFEKPKGYTFIPGQATDLTINKPDWKDKKNPFTFTGLNEDPYVQFTIKGYPDHHGVTQQLHQLQPGDTVFLHDVWGAIEYHGPGVFLAGGAGITPFLAIFRQLHKDHKAAGNTLYFSNKTKDDIIEHQELIDILGVAANFILTNDNTEATGEHSSTGRRPIISEPSDRGYIPSTPRSEGYLHTRINKTFLKEQISDFKQPFYICGPDAMVAELNNTLKELGANPESVVFEK